MTILCTLKVCPQQRSSKSEKAPLLNSLRVHDVRLRQMKLGFGFYSSKASHRIFVCSVEGESSSMWLDVVESAILVCFKLMYRAEK